MQQCNNTISDALDLESSGRGKVKVAASGHETFGISRIYSSGRSWVSGVSSPSICKHSSNELKCPVFNTALGQRLYRFGRRTANVYALISLRILLDKPPRPTQLSYKVRHAVRAYRYLNP